MGVADGMYSFGQRLYKIHKDVKETSECALIFHGMTRYRKDDPIHLQRLRELESRALHAGLLQLPTQDGSEEC